MSKWLISDTQIQATATAISEGTSLLAVWQLIAAAVATPSAVVVVAAIWKAITWWFGRKDTNKHIDHSANMTYEQQLQAAFLASGARMDTNTQWMIQHLKEFLDQSEHEKIQIENTKNDEIAEKIRYRELAQHWYWTWRELAHDLAEARQIGLSLAKVMVENGLLDKEKVPNWEPIKEKPPAMEDPLPKPKGDADGPKLPATS